MLVIVFSAAPDGEPCEMCGEVSELRPYGENDAMICITCARKDMATTRRQYLKWLESDNNPEGRTLQ